MRHFYVVFAILFGAVIGANAEVTFSKFDFVGDLRGRHPELVRNEAFASWMREQGVGPWHESRLDNARRRTVVVLARAEDRLFAAQINAEQNEVLRAAQFDLRPLHETRGDVFGIAARKIAPGDLIAIRPVVVFADGAKPAFHWEIEAREDSSIETFAIRGTDLVPLRSRAFTPLAPAPSSNAAAPPAPDDMADDELHHLAAFRGEASGWVSGATTVQEKAKRIFERVRDTYTYDSTIIHISEFTWADSLTRDRNGRRGICDEWSVVTISYLRSVGIPARLKLLTWTEAGHPEAHAALEYADGATWRHMDPLWDAFNNPAVYRQKGVTAIAVMDADYPFDARSTRPAWGVPDPTGDGLLYPYGDFILAPAYPGEARAGYSH